MPRPDESLGGARPSHVSWCAARELTRVAVAETESAWLDAALGKTLRELGALVANKCPGDAPDAPPTEGDLVPIDAAVVDSALCDAQHLGELLPSAVQPTAIETPSSARRAANENATFHAPPQTIPPALRRAVLARDRHRCTVPGCSHATFVDVHHIQPRSEGGRHEASNLLTLCSAHHRSAHRGELHIERGPDGALRFRHADGAAYGNPLTPGRVDAHAKVFSALRNLGFPESAAGAVLRELRADVELAAASVQHLLREALSRIRPAAR